MEKEEKNQRPCKPPETDLFLQWGNRKRLRCVRKETSFPPPPSYLTSYKNSKTLAENRKSSTSPKKEERFYTTRGSVVGLEENGKVFSGRWWRTRRG
ncbi:unnamed protein product [Ilex paraguariensis]|uniref:Uncharacterized protein n=1 Tax=Ilex paraguariensis TaxID=185542 RepID=A0ABC8S2P7_9AQUA